MDIQIASDFDISLGSYSNYPGSVISLFDSVAPIRIQSPIRRPVVGDKLCPGLGCRGVSPLVTMLVKYFGIPPVS